MDSGLGQPLTEIETKILDFMVHYLRSNTYQPSIREIGERFGIKSTKTVSEHLQALADKGFLERDPSRSRGVKILGMDLSAQVISVPCFSSIPRESGGVRIDAPDLSLAIDRRLVGSRAAFFVRVRGDHLAQLNVNDGDLLLVEPARPGDLDHDSVVIVDVIGEADYYRFSRNGRGAVLSPLSGGGPPTVVEDVASMRIIGRVTGLHRQSVEVPALVSTVAH